MGPVDSSLIALVGGGGGAFAAAGYPDVQIVSPPTIRIPKDPEVVHKVSVRVSYDSSQL